MAQKLGLALIALFGFANAQVGIPYGGSVILLSGPPPHRNGGLTSHGRKDDDDESGPKLGEKTVVLGHSVTLGQAQSDDHDEGHGFDVVNYAFARKGENGAHKDGHSNPHAE